MFKKVLISALCLSLVLPSFLFLLPTTIGNVSAQIIENGDFELTSSPFCWQRSEPTWQEITTADLTTAEAHSGVQSLLVDESVDFRSDVIPVTPGEGYVLTAWLKCEDFSEAGSGDGGWLQLKVIEAPSWALINRRLVHEKDEIEQWCTNRGVGGDGAWHELEVAFTVPAGVTGIRVLIDNGSRENTLLYWDHFELDRRCRMRLNPGDSVTVGTTPPESIPVESHGAVPRIQLEYRTEGDEDVSLRRVFKTSSEDPDNPANAIVDYVIPRSSSITTTTFGSGVHQWFKQGGRDIDVVLKNNSASTTIYIYYADIEKRWDGVRVVYEAPCPVGGSLVQGVSSDLEAVLASDWTSSIEEGGVGQDGLVSVGLLSDSGNRVGEFNVNFDRDLVWDNLSGGSDGARSFVHVDGLLDGLVGGTFALYATKGTGTQVLVCPGAEGLTDVQVGCPGGELYVEGGPYTLGNGDVITVEVVNFSGVDYWKMSGLTGTGIMDVPKEPNTPPEVYYLRSTRRKIVWKGKDEDKKDRSELTFKCMIDKDEWFDCGTGRSRQKMTNVINGLVKEHSLSEGEHEFSVKVIVPRGLESDMKSVQFKTSKPEIYDVKLRNRKNGRLVTWKGRDEDEGSRKLQYSYKVGEEGEWSEWARVRKVLVTHSDIPAQGTTFYVKAMDSSGLESGEYEIAIENSKPEIYNLNIRRNRRGVRVRWKAKDAEERNGRLQCEYKLGESGDWVSVGKQRKVFIRDEDIPAQGVVFYVRAIDSSGAQSESGSVLLQR